MSLVLDSLSQVVTTFLGTSCSVSLVLLAAITVNVLLKCLVLGVSGMEITPEPVTFAAELVPLVSLPTVSLTAFVTWLVIPMAVLTGGGLWDSAVASVALLRRSGSVALLLHLVVTSAIGMLAVIVSPCAAVYFLVAPYVVIAAVLMGGGGLLLSMGESSGSKALANLVALLFVLLMIVYMAGPLLVLGLVLVVPIAVATAFVRLELDGRMFETGGIIV